MARAVGLLVALRDGHRHSAAGRYLTGRAAFVHDPVIDDLHAETIRRVAGAAARIDGDAPAAVEAARRIGVAGGPPLHLAAGARWRGGFPSRTELASILVNVALRQRVGCHQSSDKHHHAQGYALHVSAPSRLRSSTQRLADAQRPCRLLVPELLSDAAEGAVPVARRWLPEQAHGGIPR